jgi:hypothetical protein
MRPAKERAQFSKITAFTVTYQGDWGGNRTVTVFATDELGAFKTATSGPSALCAVDNIVSVTKGSAAKRRAYDQQRWRVWPTLTK